MTLLHGILNALPLPEATRSRYFVYGKLTGPGFEPREMRLVLDSQIHGQAFLYFHDELRNVKSFITRITAEKLADRGDVTAFKVKLSNGKEASGWKLAVPTADLKKGLAYFAERA